GAQNFYRELFPSRGFQSSVDFKQEIGLGKLSQVDSMVITWPNGSKVKFDPPAINKLYSIEEPPGSPIPVAQPALPKDSTLSNIVKSNFDKHEEDNNIDFYYEHNVPKM